MTVNREARAQSYDEEMRAQYAAYLEMCNRDGLTPGYGDIVEWAEGIPLPGFRGQPDPHYAEFADTDYPF